ncbi:YfhO family protein [Rubellicoccus peritrichatus]|uniref:YfhO family protein n=1 Tax=Rubellicoccus peritrichatus TaxID=3080537 RepID=A0AAQ3LC77_9BACT|nr:YfhO family protein [Puniceicoccus sp. CR14]WOO41859.1 YfhO family protein [Puniceicoccus sp. CR14]
MRHLASRIIQLFLKCWEQQRYALLITLGVLLLGNFAIYFDFINTRRLFLFYDAGSDSATQLLPFAHYFANIRDITTLWEHRTGLGNNQFLMSALYTGYDPLLLLFKGRNPEWIGAHLEYFAIIKSLIAGVFFFAFLRLRGFSSFAGLVGGCCWAMSGMFVAIATWFVSITPSHSAALAMVLWGYQYWRNGKSPLPLVVAFAYFIISTQAFITVPQLGVFFFLFILYDWWSETKERLSFSELFWRYLKFGLYCLWGLMLVAPLILPTLYYVFLENPRMGGDFSISLFELPKWIDLFTNFTRAFSNDLFGTANSWNEQISYPDYFMIPFNYFGIIWIVWIPVYAISVFRTGDRDDQVRLIKLLIFCLPFVVVLLMPGIRSYLFYGGKANYYRWVCNYSGVAYLLLGACALDWLFKKGIGSLRWLPVVILASVLVLLSGVLYYLNQYRGLSLDPWTIGIVVFGLFGATLALSLRSAMAAYIVLALIAFFDLTTQGNRSVSTTRNSLWTIEQRPAESHLIYSEPDMSAALADIKARDSSLFYRISKPAEYGARWDNSSLSQNYMGTRAYHSFNNKNVVEFYYTFTNQQPDFWGPIALPGFDEFGLLDNISGVRYYASYLPELLPEWVTEVNRFGGIGVYENPYAFPLAVPYYRYADSSLFDFYDNRHARQQLIYDTVMLDETVGREDLTGLEEVTSFATEWSDETRNAALQNRAKANEAFALDHFGEDTVEGHIVLEEPAMLVFSIPYDPGWSAWVNGEDVAIERANIGFMGVPLEAGENVVHLAYWPPFFTFSLLLCGFAIVGLFVIPKFCFKRNVVTA